MSKAFDEFKAGDRVKLLRNVDHAEEGMIGTCVEDYPKDRRGYDVVPVEFDEEFEGGHSCGGRTIGGHGHWIYPGYLEKLDSPHAFTLVITSKGDHTEAKFLRGKEIIKTAEVNRYKDDEYSQPAAIHAIVDKMFPRDSAGITKDEPEEPSKFTGKAVFKAEVSDGFTKGCIYEFRRGQTTDNFEVHRPKGYEKYSCCEWENWFNARFIAIVDREDKT